MDQQVPGVHTFELNGHSYLVQEHPAGEGMEIMYELLGLGAPTVLGLAAAAIKSEELLRAVLEAMKGVDSEVTMGDLGGMLSSLDLGSAGAELGKAIGTGKAPGLTKKILSRTHRDRQPIARCFDTAYQANYAELLQAVWKVCTINRFFPVPSMSPSLPDEKEIP